MNVEILNEVADALRVSLDAFTLKKLNEGESHIGTLVAISLGLQKAQSHILTRIGHRARSSLRDEGLDLELAVNYMIQNALAASLDSSTDFGTISPRPEDN